MSNPFYQTLDWTVRGKLCRVMDGETTFTGWLDRVNHHDGSVVIHSATIERPDGNTETIGGVYVESPGTIEVIKPSKTVEYVDLDDLQPHPDHPQDFNPEDRIIRGCYRNQFAKSFPVIRESNGTIINGHKRIAAAEAAGLEKHPVEVVNVTDEQAQELFELAHDTNDESSEGSENSQDQDSTSLQTTNPHQSHATQEKTPDTEPSVYY